MLCKSADTRHLPPSNRPRRCGRPQARPRFAALQDAFARASSTGHVVMMVTISNACPIPTDAQRGGNSAIGRPSLARHLCRLASLLARRDHRRARALRLILRLVGPLQGQSVLDVGCGDGTLALVCARRGALRVSGCDPDPRMIDQARALAACHEPGIGLAVARSQGLPYADHSFDVVTCITVLAFVPDAEGSASLRSGRTSGTPRSSTAVGQVSPPFACLGVSACSACVR